MVRASQRQENWADVSLVDDEAQKSFGVRQRGSIRMLSDERRDRRPILLSAAVQVANGEKYKIQRCGCAGAKDWRRGSVVDGVRGERGLVRQQWLSVLAVGMGTMGTMGGWGRYDDWSVGGRLLVASDRLGGTSCQALRRRQMPRSARYRQYHTQTQCHTQYHSQYPLSRVRGMWGGKAQETDFFGLFHFVNRHRGRLC